MATKKLVAVRKPSLGVQIDALFKLRERLREIQAEEKTQMEWIAGAEAEVMELMKAEGLEKSTGKLASVSISSTVTGNVVDWDAFWAYVYKNKFGHLLQKRVSDPGIRELFETKGKVPGVEPFTKERLNLRKTT
jgi:hypothetical protein